MEYIYYPKGTCSKQIILDLNKNNNTINNVCFIGGCPGNTLGLASLLKNMNIEDAINKLDGIKCGMKSTSCPDQLSKALKMFKESKL